MFTNALALINAAKLNIVGCVGVMHQGETDGDNSVSSAIYKTALIDLLARMRAHSGIPGMNLIIAQIGTKNTGDTTQYQAIRTAQADLARDGTVLMGHAGCKYFQSRGLMMDTFHYLAAGYDEIGLALGQAVAAHGIGSRPSGLSE